MPADTDQASSATPRMEPRRRAMLQGFGSMLALSAATAHLWALADEPGASADRFARNFEGRSWRDQDGRAFQFDRLRGRVVLVNFVFTACSTVCPLQTAALVDLRRRLAPGVAAATSFVSVSLDPLSDGPEVLRAYARARGADGVHWRWVAGAPQATERLVERLRLRRGSDPQTHRTALWLVDRQGRLVQRYEGQSPDPARLARELASLHAVG